MSTSCFWYCTSYIRVKCYHWGKLWKGIQESLSTIFATSYEFIIINKWKVFWSIILKVSAPPHAILMGSHCAVDQHSIRQTDKDLSLGTTELCDPETNFNPVLWFPRLLNGEMLGPAWQGGYLGVSNERICVERPGPAERAGSYALATIIMTVSQGNISKSSNSALTFKNRLRMRHRVCSPDMVPGSGLCFFGWVGSVVNVVFKGITTTEMAVMTVDSRGPPGGTSSEKRHFLHSGVKGVCFFFLC